ncbi:LytTR family transcriptional regulator DNA-binding domain-containing protein [Larkinella bovis]|uniref:LytTR family transcriptional regulator DNA-binding domain-containing protein n=1 Tax=Larkinella bovis TaxID=683041 RepID=A0ABW0IEE1_9BACT
MLLINDSLLQRPIHLVDIVYIYTEKQTPWIVFMDDTTQQCVSVSGSLENWEKQLPEFWRINESYLINPALIYRFHPAELPHFPLPLIELITGRTFAVSRRKTKTVLQKWNRLQRSILS